MNNTLSPAVVASAKIRTVGAVSLHKICFHQPFFFVLLTLLNPLRMTKTPKI